MTVGFVQVQATDPHDLEPRVAVLEAILTPTVLNQPVIPTSHSIQPDQLKFVTLQYPQNAQCNYININTVLEPNLYVDGWCPASSEFIYFIRDIRVVADSLVIINVQRSQDRIQTEIQTPPVCNAISSGTLVFPTTTFRGFILNCIGDSPLSTDTLRYTIL